MIRRLASLATAVLISWYVVAKEAEATAAEARLRFVHWQRRRAWQRSR